MVLLTITPIAKAAIELYNRLRSSKEDEDVWEPSLSAPAVGGPVSHVQLIDVARVLRENYAQTGEGEHADTRLDALLKGAKVYVPPPKPKQEPTPEYKALMKRLREEEERRAYERMINPPTPAETFSQRFPNANTFGASSFKAPVVQEQDEVTYADINRQMILIINVLVSIIATSVVVWIAARHWSTPQRLGLSMTSSIVVGVAEVVIYMGYLKRIQDAKAKEGKVLEKKEIIDTWVIDGKEKRAITDGADGVRHRKGKHR